MRYNLSIRIPRVVRVKLRESGNAPISEAISRLIESFDETSALPVDIKKMPGPRETSCVCISQNAGEKLRALSEKFELPLIQVANRMVEYAMQTGDIFKFSQVTEKPPKQAPIDGSFLYVGIAISQSTKAVKYGITTDLVTRMRQHKSSMSKLKGAFIPMAFIRMPSIDLAKRCESDLKRKYEIVEGINAFKQETAHIMFAEEILKSVREFQTTHA